MKWNELGLKKKLTKYDIKHLAREEDGPQKVNEIQQRDVGSVVITLEPLDPKEFKKKLLKTKKAQRILHYANGQTKEEVWRANSFTENSNLMCNIQSSAVYRTAAQKGIVRISYHV